MKDVNETYLQLILDIFICNINFQYKINLFAFKHTHNYIL